MGANFHAISGDSMYLFIFYYKFTGPSVNPFWEKATLGEKREKPPLMVDP
jgi:hypothetical protein